jgi:phosphopantetheinyl transferase (holo-ACP synthase)
MRTIGDEPSVDDWGALTDADLARAARFTHVGAMTRFATGRALLRATVAQHQPDLAPESVRFEVTPSGRLDVAERPELRVSLSHTGSVAVAAVSDAGPVGIDVEPLDRRELPRPSAWLTPEELEGLAHLDAHTPHEAELHRLMLLHLWVAKEAALKAWTGRRSTTRRRIRIACPAEPCGDGPPPEPPDRGASAASAPIAADAADRPRDARWCGSGEALVTGQDEPQHAHVASGPLRSSIMRLDWYVIRDGYLVALAHEGRAVGD